MTGDRVRHLRAAGAGRSGHTDISETMTDPHPAVIGTQEGLDALAVGSVVMTLWDIGPVHAVMQKYSDGWYGFPSERALFPLGSGRQGELVLVLWNADLASWARTEERP